MTERKRSEAELVAAIEAAMADTKWFGRGVMESLPHFESYLDRLLPSSSTTSQGANATFESDCRGAGDAEISAELNFRAIRSVPRRLPL